MFLRLWRPTAGLTREQPQSPPGHAAALLPVLEAAAGVTGQHGARTVSPQRSSKNILLVNVEKIHMPHNVWHMASDLSVLPCRVVQIGRREHTLNCAATKAQVKKKGTQWLNTVKRLSWDWVGERLGVGCGMCRHTGWKGSERNQGRQRGK